MPTNSTVQTSFIQISDDTALYLSGNDALPPTLCPDLVPAGWELVLTDDGDPEGLTFTVGDEFVEAYLLQRTRGDT